MLLVWLATVVSTRSVILGVVFPIAGTLLAFVWAFWTISERISERSRSQELDLESLELLKQAIRRKHGVSSADAAVAAALSGSAAGSAERAAAGGGPPSAGDPA